MWVGEGETRRRFVVCRNLDEARRDERRRERWLERITEELEAIKGKQGEARIQAEAELITHLSMKRYISRRNGRLVIDRAKVKADAHLDGKFLISSSDDDLTAAEIALYCKQLIEVEACWRDQSISSTCARSTTARKTASARARAALLPGATALPRRRDPRARHLAQPAARARAHPARLLPWPAGHIHQRTELTYRQREILAALQEPEPPVFLAIEPSNRA